MRPRKKRELNYNLLLLVPVALVLNSIFFFDSSIQTAYASTSAPLTINDPALTVQLVTKDVLHYPTSMAFLNDSSILVLEWTSGQVHLVTNGIVQEEPVLQVPVNASGERGLLGIAVLNHINDTTDVFLYYTEADPLRNRVYKYEWDGKTLANPKLILDLPAEPGPLHNGGKIVIGPDGYLYTIIGNVLRWDGQLQNSQDGSPPDDTGVILRVVPEDGSAAPGNPFANSEDPLLSRYYAYGIRNGFGIDFDPLTGNLWDTENGNSNYDEINLVKPGFNSGWGAVMGPGSFPFSEDELVKFPGSNYADPVLSWRDSVGPTDIEFYNSTILGDKYKNNIFVGDVAEGRLYFFEVNETRDGIKLDTTQQEAGLNDLVVDNENELSSITFGIGFRDITDIETGPDGSLYVLTIDDGAIYKISPR